MATFVLVHGAWCGSLIWRQIARDLRRAGHEVHAPTLTGLGERAHLLSPEVNLHTHVRDILELIEFEELADIVLVGHSYGGMVVSGVADAIPEKIASLVYLDAFVPQNGQALFDLIPKEMPRAASVPGTDWLAAPLPVEAFGEPSAPVRDFFLRKTRPHPMACFTQPLEYTGGIGRIRRRTYIYCNDPEPSTFTPIVERIRREPGWTLRVLPCGHMAQLDMPEPLTALLLQAIPENLSSGA